MFLVAGAVVSLAFIVYRATLAPTVFWGDSAELAASAYLLGIPHPTGYPLYMLLGKFFTWALPVGDVAYRTNLLSAVFGALAVGALFLAIRRLVGDWKAAAIAALAFAFSYRFWRESIITEVYTLHALFLAAIVYCLLSWRDTGQKRYIYLSFLLFGLSLSHHGMTVLLVPALLYGAFFLGKERLKARELAVCLGLAMVGLPFYLYLPLRYAQDPTWNLAKMVGVDLTRPTELLWYMSGGLFRQAMTDWDLGRIFSQLGEGLAALTADFLIVGALLAYLGAVAQYKKEPKTFLLILITLALNLAFVAMYRVPDTEDFAVFLTLISSLWLGVGLALSLSWLSNLVKRVWQPIGHSGWATASLPFLGLGLLPLSLFLFNIRYLDYSEKYAPKDYAREILASLPEGAVLLMQFPGAPLWYAQMVEGMRPDVTLIDRGLIFLRKRAFSGVAKRTEIISAVNRELLEEYKERPLFIVSYDPDIASEWSFEDLGTFYRLHKKGPPLIRSLNGEDASRGLLFGESLRLYDVSLEPTKVMAGKLLRLKLSWVAEKPPSGDFKLSFRFESSSEGKRNGDQKAFAYEIRWRYDALGPKDWPTGRLLEESYDLYIPREADGGPYILKLMLSNGNEILPAFDGTAASPYLGALLGQITVEAVKR